MSDRLLQVEYPGDLLPCPEIGGTVIQYADDASSSAPPVKGTSTPSLADRPRCEPGEKVLFFDDFEDGLDQRWFFQEADGGKIDDWPVEVDDGNHILVGTGHNWAEVRNASWTDYSLHLRLRHVSEFSDAHINIRNSKARYYLSLRGGVLSRDFHTGEQELRRLAMWSPAPGTVWHELTLSAVGENLEVTLDGKLIASPSDPNPLPPGGIGLESLRGTTWFDDVLVCGR